MSPLVFGIVFALFATAWLALAIRGIVREIKKRGRIKWVIGLMGFLVVVGSGGFFAAGLASLDILKFPNSFQWPAGYTSGVVRTPDGKYVVPLVPPDESSFTIRNGISYVAGMLMRPAVISRSTPC